MGDVLHGLPAVSALRKVYPHARIGWAVEPRWRALLSAFENTALGESRPVVNRIHAVPTRRWKARPFTIETLGEIAGLRQELLAEQYDLSIDLQGAIRSAAIGWLSGAHRRIGPQPPREAAASLLYRQRVPLQSPHVIHQACELVAAGLDLPALPPAAFTLSPDEEAEGWCSATLARLGIKPPFVLLAASAGWGAKEWGTQRYSELAGRLQAAGYPVLVNASPGRDSVVAEAVAAGQHALRIVSSLPQLIALTRRASLVIGGDSGPIHLAAALGRPVLALFGPTDPARTGPADFPASDSHVRVLRDAGSIVSHKRVAETEAGLARIPVAEAAESAFRLLRQTQDATTPGAPDA